MNEVWCLLEQERQRELAAEVARLGNQTGCVPCGVLVGEVDPQLAEDLGRYGIAKVYSCALPHATHVSAGQYVSVLTSLIQESPPFACLFAASPLGNEVAARVAVRLGAGLVTCCTDLTYASGQLVATKKAYNGNLSRRVAWKGSSTYLATIAPEMMEALPADKSCLPELARRSFPVGEAGATFIARSRLGWQELPLVEAVGVLGVGAGVANGDAVGLIQRLASLLNVPIGGTKRADELGLIPRDRRIGASGVSIDPEVYIAMGISGASHHLVGIRKAKHVVAINPDKAAPIFDIAELGIVDDFCPVVQALVDQLSTKVPESTQG